MTTRADKAAALHDEITTAAMKRLVELCDNHMDLAATVAHRMSVRLEAFNRYYFLNGVQAEDVARAANREPSP